MAWTFIPFKRLVFENNEIDNEGSYSLILKIASNVLWYLCFRSL